MSWEAYQTAYNAANQSVKKTLDSEIIPNCVEKVIVGQQLNPEHKRILVQQTTFQVLGVHTPEQAEVELKKVSVADAARILSTIVSCVKNASPETLEQSEAAVQSTPAAIPTPQAVTPPAQQPAPAAPPIPQAPQQPAGVPKIRTMKDDMNQSQGMAQAPNASAQKEQTYTSTQEAILKEGSQKPKGEIPPPPPPRAI